MAILKSVFVVATADREGTDSSSRRHGFDFWVNYLEILLLPLVTAVFWKACKSVGPKFKWLRGLTALTLP